ncbi:MAG: DUF2357 domain-containing protein [Treponema sp.]|nr:DUF2357 domain-containing protein [Treponema sp.]
MAEELSKIYRQIASGSGKQYEYLFSLEGLFLSAMDFDPVTDDPLPVTVDDVLYAFASFDFNKVNFQKDRLQHIVGFVSSAICNLIDILHEKNLREHRITRPEQVREVDSKSMMWLAKKPGFTVKQKIASEQRMMGVYHTTSLDTAENRLFKSFMEKLDELLLEKENACKKSGKNISDEDERFTSTVHRWLKSDEADCIGRWNNTPPNNTLLNDKNYRKIWKAHLMLQNLNELVQKDLDNIERIKIRVFFWLTAARLNLSKDIRFRQTLLFPDYENLSLTKDAKLVGFVRTNAWGKFTISAKSDAIVLSINEQETEYSLPNDVENLFDIFDCAEQICKDTFPKKKFNVEILKQVQNDKTQAVAAVDLNSIFPTFTFGDKTQGRFSKKLVHQSLCFLQEKKDFWYPCSSYQSKLIFTKSKNIKTFSVHSVFDEKLRSEIDSEEDKNAIEKACTDFAKTVKNELLCQKCLYITNDDLDDFSPTVNAFKHCMNSAFSKTEILPKSIAAVFSRFSDVQNCFGEKDEICVRTIFDDYEIKTKIRIKIDEELLMQNPETKGYCFQRLGFERIELNQDSSKDFVPENLRGILTFQDANLLRNEFSADDFHFEDKKSLRKFQAQKNEIIVFADDDTSIGAIEYERLQRLTPDIPLWSDFLPKLSMVDSSGREYVLVEPEKVSIRPLVGKPVHIPISWRFSFPAKKAFYEFPLAQGEKKEKSKYFAFIKDSSFPLENETECSLYLTYTYGMPLPYNLEFLPVSDSAEFKSVVVKWKNKSHKDYIHDMPVPNFVREYTWADMTSVAGRMKDGKIENSNLTGEWLPKEFAKIRNSGVYQIRHQIPSKKIGQGVFFLDRICPNGKNPICYIEDKQHAMIGSRVWCYLDRVANGYQAFDPHVVGSKYNVCGFTKSLRFPAITVWNNGRSILDVDCPQDFRNETIKIVQKLQTCFGKETPECVKNEYMFLLSCMHKDMPDWFSSFMPTILSKIENNYDYPNWIAYSLGDCSMDWQKDLLSKTLSLLDKPAKSVYAIKILAKALWRVNSFVFNLRAEDVEKLLLTIKQELCSNENQNAQEQTAVFSACLECLVALCRLRKTKDGDMAEDKMLKLLSPIENENVRQIVEKFRKMKKGEVKIKTFLSFDIDRPADDKTPELLYAAYGYLSGEIDSNAIKVLEADFAD